MDKITDSPVFQAKGLYLSINKRGQYQTPDKNGKPHPKTAISKYTE
jgi:hypothetical protein